jgi:hypothetical protein
MLPKAKPIDPQLEFQAYVPAAAAYRLIMIDIVEEIVKTYGNEELLNYSNVDNIGRLFNAFDSYYFDRERATSFLKGNNHSSEGVSILNHMYQMLNTNKSILGLKNLYQRAGNLAYADDILFIIENKIRRNRKLYLTEISRYAVQANQQLKNRYHHNSVAVAQA